MGHIAHFGLKPVGVKDAKDDTDFVFVNPEDELRNCVLQDHGDLARVGRCQHDISFQDTNPYSKTIILFLVQISYMRLKKSRLQHKSLAKPHELS